HLRHLCQAGLRERYRGKDAAPAEAQLQRELAVIEGLDLSDFFLVVHEVVHFARSRGIRCAGRGSAANSIVAYVLGITAVDPIEHKLLFERFLHAGRKGTPDIDVDFDTSRRDEVIEWMESRFGGEHTAMTANVNTYQARSAVRDVAKALGWPLPVVDEMTRVLGYYGRCGRVGENRKELESVVGPSPLLDVLIAAVERLDGCPRHLSLHSGGMLLTRHELWRHTPTRLSANGVKQAVFDKEDVELMGLVKLDVLGLRSLAAVSAAAELHEAATGEKLPLDNLSLDDPYVYEMICQGETLALFQVESPGQMALIARHQPRNFQELVAEIALLRPGPLQGGVVHPFVRRARGLDPVTFPHPCLEDVLADTFGIILYQEQVLEVAHKFAGLSLEESDEFRRLMSKWRDPGEMGGMRDRFVRGALRAHPDLDEETAERVFFQVSQFVGYGFPRSHAAAFARTVYQTAWLKRYHPAAYMAAVMEHHPGMYPRQSLLTEARRHGVQVLGPSLERSGRRYSLEEHHGKLAIRMPLTAVNGVAAGDADVLLLERAARPFADADDLYRRAVVSRDVLWQLGVLERKLGAPGLEAPPLLDAPALEEPDLARLAALTPEEAAAWDVRAAGASAGPHPVSIRRAALDHCGVTPIGRVTADRVVSVAGHVIARQRPGTAHGIVFITLEDETGRIQCIAYPQVWEKLKTTLKMNALILTGKVTRERQWRGLMIQHARHLSAVGGVAGAPHG
ncbi:MAG TPA: DNA polymerase III subunit alpha, partial [Deinococcales bacterium]|nr:DNA polymerase III subunit alpha [Deinococcales bacterium]